MENEKQMSIKTDEPKSFTSYLLKFKKVFKKVLFIAILLFINIGAKYPVMSESTSNVNDIKVVTSTDIKAEYERYVKMYQEIYKSSLIQEIEFESEVLIPENFDFKYVEYAYKISKEIGIPTRVMFRLIFRESTFDDNVISCAGATGLMQLMPSTRNIYYKNLRVDTLKLDLNQQDIYIGAHFLKDLQEFWRKRGNSERNVMGLSLAAYNAGPGKVIKYKGIPPYKDTNDFVIFILKPHSNPVFYSNILQKSLKKTTS